MNWNFLNPFKNTKLNPVLETKSSGDYFNLNYGSSCGNSLISFLSGADCTYNSISAEILWSCYKSVKPMRHAVEGIVSQNFSSIKPAIYDKQEKRFLNSNEEVDLSNFLKVFEKPNVYQSSKKFKETFAPSYFVTGNLYLIVDIGILSNQPVYICYVPPQDVNPIKDSSDGYVRSYSVTTNNQYETFKRVELEDGEIAFYNDDESRELIPIANFNPSSQPQEGLSPLSSTLAEIEQYWQGNFHNNSFIKKGARPSGMIMIHPEADLTAQQEERLRSLVEKSTSGENTGKVLVAQGATNFKELSVNNKDMDYIQLMERAKVEIYTTLNIPLPMIKDKAMTLNNYQESKFMLHDMSIFPFADMIYAEINRKISKYYDTQENRYEISYNKDEVDATKVRRNQETERLGKSGALTVNEHRDLLGYSKIAEGDTIYQPVGLVPMGSQVDLQQEKESGQKQIKLNKKVFIKSLKKTGQYTNQEIQERANKLYG